jgi:hypothetical protein
VVGSEAGEGAVEMKKMIMLTGPLPRGAEGRLLSRNEYGCPIVYWTPESQVICPGCAVSLEDFWGITPIGWGVNTDPHLDCFSCEDQIPYVESPIPNRDMR